MTGTASIREKFNTLAACVIIPTYNNAATLAGVIESVKAYTDHIIVVNDGSTDDTGRIAQQYPQYSNDEIAVVDVEVIELVPPSHK